MWIVRLALNRPYTFVVLALLILMLRPLVILRTPTDIFPNINIPVIAVVWQYTGLNPRRWKAASPAVYERVLTTPVDDIEHIESQPSTAWPSSRSSSSRRQSRYRQRAGDRDFADRCCAAAAGHAAAADDELQRLERAHPAAGAFRHGLSEQQLNDLGLNFLRTQLVTVPGASCPIPTAASSAQIDGRSQPAPRCRPSGLSPGGRGRTRSRAEPDPALRHRQDRRSSNTTWTSTPARRRWRS